MGCLSGLVTWILVGTLFKASVKQIPIISGQMLGIFTFWLSGGLGGDRLLTSFLQSVDSTEMFYYYAFTLTCIWTPVAVAKVIVIIMQHAKETARLEKQQMKRSSDA